MSNKPTLAEKKLINDNVTGETKRCLAIIERARKNTTLHIDGLDWKDLIKEIIENSPYIEFHPELLKRIPK